MSQFNLPVCGAGASCIDSTVAIGIFVAVITAFALGYGIGQAVLWVRRLSEVI
jgi:hypothetical protein